MLGNQDIEGLSFFKCQNNLCIALARFNIGPRPYVVVVGGGGGGGGFT